MRTRRLLFYSLSIRSVSHDNPKQANSFFLPLPCFAPLDGPVYALYNGLLTKPEGKDKRTPLMFLITIIVTKVMGMYKGNFIVYGKLLNRAGRPRPGQEGQDQGRKAKTRAMEGNGGHGFHVHVHAGQNSS